MKKAIFTMMSLFLLLADRVYAYDDGDFQIWNTDVEEFKIGKNSKIALEEEFRWGDNASEFFYQHYDIGYFYSLKEHLHIGGGYRQIFELKSGKFKPENAPYLILTLSGDLSGFKFEDRSRFEYRHFDYQTDTWRYRNKLTLKAPWKLTRLEIQPFLSDEILIGLGTVNQFSQNRFSLGIDMNLIKNLKAGLYYMLLTNRGGGGKWKDSNVLGAKAKIIF